MTGASLANDVDRILTEAGVLARRLPFQADPVLRQALNDGKVTFVDQHLSETVELLRSRQMGPIDVAIVEAVAITEDGGIVPTTSVGNSATFAILAEKVIVEIDLSQPPELEGMHDLYIPTRRPFREPIPVVAPESRVGFGNCVSPLYRDRLADYFERALRRGGHTPHVLEDAFSWHLDFMRHGSMRRPGALPLVR